MPGQKKYPQALLKMRSLGRISAFIAKMRYIALCMTDNAMLFPSPSPTMLIFKANIDALEEAEAVANRHTTGSAALRNTQYDIVYSNVRNLLNYVQTLADNAPDEIEAIKIINSSGFDVKEYGVKTKPDLEARNTDISGTVKLIAKPSGKYSPTEWRISTDKINWTNLPSTRKASTFVSGLTPATIVHFQHRPILKDRTGSWSQIVTIVVT